MATTISQEEPAAPARQVLTNKGDVFASFAEADFAVPHGRDEEWKFTPLRRLRGLHDGTAAAGVPANVTVDSGSREGVQVELVGRDDNRRGQAGTPTDRVAAAAYEKAEQTTVVTFAANSASEELVTVNIEGPGADQVAYGHLIIKVEAHAEAVVVLNYRGSGTFADNVEFQLGDGARLAVVTMVNWNDDAVHLSAHHGQVGRDATLRHAVATFGGEVVRVVPRVKFVAPGGDAELLGVYFADQGQYFENRLLVDHSEPNCRSNVMYKGALQGDTEGNHREARTAWVGDVLIRAAATGTDTYELNRNLLLTEGARADAVPNLEIETGEIAGAGHAATVGRFDEEQLFYLLSRGIPELTARRLVVRGFFSEVINLIPVQSVREKLEALVDEELNTVGL